MLCIERLLYKQSQPSFPHSAADTLRMCPPSTLNILYPAQPAQQLCLLHPFNDRLPGFCSIKEGNQIGVEGHNRRNS